MEKLTIEHIAPYLPYGLKISHPYGNHVMLSEIEPFDDFPQITIRCVVKDGYKPLLRPLSDLTKEIEHNGERFAPMHRIPNWFSLPTWWHDGDAVPSDMNAIPYYVIQLLFEWHFDVFGLIEKNLAIDINTLKQ